jgi:hypothetical protein
MLGPGYVSLWRFGRLRGPEQNHGMNWHLVFKSGCGPQ